MPDLAVPRAATVPADALPRLARRLARPLPGSAWTPPPLTDLIARIDQAVAARRG